MVVLVMLWLFAPIGIVESCADKKYGVTIVCLAIFFMGIILIFVLWGISVLNIILGIIIGLYICYFINEIKLAYDIIKNKIRNR